MSDPMRTQQAPLPAKSFPWRGVLIGCGVLAIVGVLAACVGGAILYHVVQPPDDVVVTVAAPAELAIGQEADLVVTVNNQRGDTLHLSDIDLADGYVSGFNVVSTDPEPKSRRGYGLLGIQSFTFDATIPAGASQVFTFKLRAVTAGVYRGDVDVSLGMGMITKAAESVVREPAP